MSVKPTDAKSIINLYIISVGCIMKKVSKRRLTGTELKDYNFKHTKYRAKKRYSLILNRSSYNELCNVIKENRFISVFKRRKVQDVYKIKFKNTILYALYSSNGNRITTVLPFQNFE